MNLTNTELQVLNKFGQPFQVEQLGEAFRISEEIINNLDDVGIKELLGGSTADIDSVYQIILEETLMVLYGQENKIQQKLSYFDNLTNQIEETLCIENLTYFILSKMPQFDLNWHHLEWGDVAQRYKKFNIIAARDHGKCLSPNTKVLMYDGSLKSAIKIKVGDLLMGVDSKPRKVLSLHSGVDDMFRINQSKGDSYEVNSKHTLTLIHKNRISKKREIVDIDLPDLMKHSDNWIAERYRGFKVSVDFNDKNVPIEPYWLGLWLGDGSKHNTSITTADFEIVDYLDDFCKKNNLELIKNKDSYNYLCKTIYVKGGGNKNHLKQKLIKLNVLNNKHIPEIYIVNSKQKRLEILAGLIDSDGYYKHGTFKFTSIYRHLSLQVKRIADSLGLTTRFHESTSYNKKLGRDYYHSGVIIGGNIHEIPTKIKRKQAKFVKNKPSNKLEFDDLELNVTNQSSIKIEPIGKGKYVGFTVDEDNRFLLADNTVTHNSYYWSNAYIIWKMYRYKPYIGRGSRKDLSISKKGYLFSFSREQATDLLEILKGTIEENDDLKERLYPGKSDGWAKTEIKCKNGASLKTKGFGSSVRGAHPGYIIVDDGLKDNVIYSSTQRKKSIDYFHAVIMNMIVPTGQVGVVGTPFHANDLYGDLKSKVGWHVREYPAIFPNGTILWRERWNFQDLMDKKETQGNLIFSRENLVKPVTNDSTIFPEDVIKRSYVGMDDYIFVRSRDAYKIKFDRVVMACDFSISSNVGADYTVIMTAGIDDKENIWLMNITRFKGKKFGEQMQVIQSLNHSFKPDLIVMENNVFQQIFVQEGDKLGMPVEGHTTGSNKYDLKAGLPGVAILYERGKIRCPRGNNESIQTADSLALELQSVTWTENGLEGVGEHDDQAMCLWLLTVASKKVTSGFSFKFL